jgi:YD repeat-containing protein
MTAGGALARLKRPDNKIIEITADDENNITQVTDERLKASTWTYNERGLLVQNENARGDIEQYVQTATGFLKTVVNARGKSRSYFPNVLDDVYSLTQADGTVEVWNYDNSCNITNYWAGYGSSDQTLSTNVYDGPGRLTSVDYPRATFNLAILTTDTPYRWWILRVPQCGVPIHGGIFHR